MQSRLVIAAIFATSLAFASQSLYSQDAPESQSASQAPAAGQGNPRRPLPKPVNLQVLPKNIAPEELVRMMRGISGALGVECNFCHAPNPKGRGLDFASDAKPDKAMARIMMRMTKNINENFMTQIHDPDATAMDKHVSCGTCHRGHSMPEHFVPPPEQHHGPPPQGAAPPQ